MRAVNLLPRDDARSKSRQTNPVVLGGVIAGVAATAIIAAVFLTVSTGVADKQERLDAAQAELDATPLPPPADTSAATLQQERSQRVVALSTALGKRVESKPRGGGDGTVGGNPLLTVAGDDA